MASERSRAQALGDQVSVSDRYRKLSSPAIANAWKVILAELGYTDPDPHLVESPGRVANSLLDWHTMLTAPPRLETFPNAEGFDQMIATGGFRFYSLCAHHGLPFFGEVSIGYIPKPGPEGRILGLSKFARLTDYYAHRFTVQERLTQQIAEHLEKELEPVGVGVIIKAEHLCMAMRGVERPGHSTVTCDLRGAMRNNPTAKTELLTLIKF